MGVAHEPHSRNMVSARLARSLDILPANVNRRSACKFHVNHMRAMPLATEYVVGATQATRRVEQHLQRE